MKRLNTNYISATAKQPITQVTLANWQSNFDTLQQVMNNQFSKYVNDNGLGVVLSGLENSGTLSAPDISSGYVMYNGFIMYVNSFSASSITNEIGLKMTTTYDVNDPILFSDLSSHNVHQSVDMVMSDTATYNLKYSDLIFLNQGWQDYTLQSSDVTASVGTVTLDSTASNKKLSYYMDWKRMQLFVNFYIASATFSSSSVGTVYISIDPVMNALLSIAHSSLSIGRFKNTSVPVNNHMSLKVYNSTTPPLNRTISLSLDGTNFDMTSGTTQFEGQLVIDLA